MKTYRVEQIVSLVRTKYDEIGLNESGMIGGTDESDFDRIVKSCISDAYRFVINNADTSMLEGKQMEDAGLVIGDDLVGRVKLPDEFMRGITFRLSSWQSSSGNIITEDTPEYRMQSDPYACGTYQNPVTAIVHTRDGRFLELYKARTKEDTLMSFVYVPSWNPSSEEVSIPDQLSDAFIYYVAGLTATTYREDVANDFFKVAKGLLGIE